MAEIVRLQNVSKSYGSFTAVEPLSFDIQQGECFGLLGPNGAGKSSLISTIYGAAPRSAGDLKVFDHDPAIEPRAVRARVGVVTQDNCLDEALDVEGNMKIFANFYGLDAKTAKTRIAHLLEFMSLSHKKTARIRQLSGGMKRRLVFVRALLGNPDLLILDEPTTGLDPAVRQLLWEKILALKDENKSILLTTHYMEEAERLCDRLVIMNEGKIVATGRPQDLIGEHAPGFVAIYDRKKISESLLSQIRKRHECFDEASRFAVRAPRLEDLTELSSEFELQALMIRPANLEDVFLMITGKKLSQNA